MSKGQTFSQSLKAWWERELRNGDIDKVRDLPWLLRDLSTVLEEHPDSAVALFDEAMAFWRIHEGSLKRRDQ